MGRGDHGSEIDASLLLLAERDVWWRAVEADAKSLELTLRVSKSCS